LSGNGVDSIGNAQADDRGPSLVGQSGYPGFRCFPRSAVPTPEIWNRHKARWVSARPLRREPRHNPATGRIVPVHDPAAEGWTFFPVSVRCWFPPGSRSSGCEEDPRPPTSRLTMLDGEFPANMDRLNPRLGIIETQLVNTISRIPLILCIWKGFRF